MFRREPVVRQQYGGPGRRGQRAGQRTVAVGRAGNVSAAVQVQQARHAVRFE
jgi:hypothetical protein